MSEPRRYLVNEVFLSVQGEGVRSGTLNVFVRLAKCNMRCAVEPGEKSPGGFDCDTEFESGRRLTAPEIVAEVQRLWPAGTTAEPWIVLTGGEPALQLDFELCNELHRAGVRIAVETNGSILLPHRGDKEAWDAGTPMELDLVLARFFVDWITVSPKVAEHAIRQKWAHEVKYVRGRGQAAPQTAVRAQYYVVSPAHDGLRLDHDALQTCLEIVRTTPPWRLSVQQHKAWRVR